MNIDVYEAEHEAERSHWWFVGRRRLFLRMISRLGLRRDEAVLDVGSSTGTNLRMLADAGYSSVTGLDQSPVAAAYASSKGLPPVVIGDVCALEFPDASFGLVLATDIIEHVDDDHRAVAELMRVVRPGGWLLVTVPTFQSLWGPQDELSHHKRRYRLEVITALLREVGGQVEASFYFNYLLFLPIFLARRLLRLCGARLRSENDVNTPAINAVLTWIFRLDVATAPILRPPFGVSALALVRKPNH